MNAPHKALLTETTKVLRIGQGKWQKDEHAAFMDGLKTFGNDPIKIQQKVPTRSEK